MSGIDIVSTDKVYHIEVGVITIVAAVKARRLLEEAVRNPHEDPDAQNLLVNFYPMLVAASTGDIPLPEEFLQLAPAEAGKWFDEVSKLNPGTFAPAEEPGEEELEKKGL